MPTSPQKSFYDYKSRRFPWSRLAKENEGDHRLFEVYRLLDTTSSDRSIGRVFDKVYGVQDAYMKEKTVKYLENLAKKYRWKERACDWDHQQQAVRDREYLRNVAIWERRRVKSLEDNYVLSQKMKTKAGEMLDFPLEETREEEENGTKVVIRKPAKWSMQTAKDMVMDAATLEAATFTAVQGPNDIPSEDEEKTIREANLSRQDIDQLLSSGYDPDGDDEISGLPVIEPVSSPGSGEASV